MCALMNERPRIIKRSTSQGSTHQGNFSFDKSWIRIPEKNSYIADYRERAWNAYNKLSIPQTNEEAWRRTDLRELSKLASQFKIENIDDLNNEIPDSFQNSVFGEKAENQLIISGGKITKSVDPTLFKSGLVFTDLIDAEQKHPELVEKVMGKLVTGDESKFASMSAAFAQNGIFIYIPAGLVVEQPLHSLFYGIAENQALFSHLMIYLESNAQLTYVHESVSKNGIVEKALHSGIVEIILQPGAALKFVELQSWGDNVFNFTHEKVKVAEDATLEWIIGSVGSHLTKSFTDLVLNGSGAAGKVSGFYFTNNSQHLDHDTQQVHLAPNTTSDLLFKGALLDKSRSVWQGMIYVAPGADKTDGYQANRNLIISKDARADSIPGLEILADDVRCSHGATIGKVDKDQVFYLTSRGIAQADAEQLIVEGFFDPIMQRIPYEGVKERFLHIIKDKMKTNWQN